MRWAVVAFVFAGSASAQPWQVSRAGGGPLVGQIEKLEPGFALTLKEPASAVPNGDLLSFKSAIFARPNRAVEPQLILANGDVWLGTLAAGRGLAIDWNWKPDGKESRKLAVPLPAVRAIWFIAPPKPDLDPADYDWIDSAKKKDTLRLANGDVLSGTLESFAENGASLWFKPAGEAAAKSFDLATVAAVVFDPALTRMKTPKGPYAKLTTRDGARLTLTTCAGDARQLKGTLSTGGELTLPWSEVVALDVLQGKATYLADLKPKSETLEAFNGVVWPWKPNRNAKGGPLRITTALGSECFDRGLGAHSRTVLTYELNGKYRSFEVLAGLDARTGTRGSVLIGVQLDSVEKISAEMRGVTAATPRTIRLDVAKAKLLTLSVDFGPNGDVQDDLNWADARLVE